MTEPIPTAGETTVIGMPALNIPVTSNGDRPLTKDDLETMARLPEGTALLISTRGAVSGMPMTVRSEEHTSELQSLV